MVKTKSGFILGTAFLSGAAAILSLVSLGTEQWVTAEGRFTDPTFSYPPSEIKYGLFSGTYFRKTVSDTYFDISITCLVSENVCAYLCKSSSDDKNAELKKLLAGDKVDFDVQCPQVRRTNQDSSFISSRGIRAGDTSNFLNAGLYISTIAFLCLSALFGVVAAVLSVWNTASNPVEVYLSIYGLYVYNGIACVSSMFVLVFWGALFGSSVVVNVGILESITGVLSTNGFTFLGFSYWLNLPSCLMYFTSIALLYVRQHLISQEPEIKIHTTTGDKDVGEIMIY